MQNRPGVALVLVLVVIALLSLGAYTFSSLMLTEYRATDTYGRQIQARASAQSGVEYVAALLTADGGGFDEDLYDNPTLFHVRLAPGAGFTVVAPREAVDGSTAGPVGLRQGLTDESGRINVNVIADGNALNPDEGIARLMLMALPNMTEEIADSILDWIDSDEDQREYGAESVSYDTVLPRNGPIDSLEELLLVPGVTPSLLYGEDANRNGVLDPNENDGDVSLPLDNADGVLDLGWAQFLTVYSKESNLRHNAERYGEARLNLNEPLLAELYDTLEEEYGSDIALFVTAWRMNGPFREEGEEVPESVSSWNPLTGSSGSSSSTGDAATDAALQETATNMARNLFSGEGSVTRGGLDLTSGAQYDLDSFFDLVDAEVEVEIDGNSTRLSSPWTSDPGSLQQTLPELLDAFSLSTNETILGRININQAPLEVLMGIPNMPDGVPEAIIRARSSAPLGAMEEFSTAGWLLSQGLVDLPTMRLLDRYVTARGSVFRMQVVGHADRGGPLCRVEAVVDASRPLPVILLLRDLAELGPGFRRDDLTTFDVP